MNDLIMVTPYITHKMMDSRKTGTLYQQHRSFLIAMVETIYLLRVYDEDLMTKFRG